MMYHVLSLHPEYRDLHRSSVFMRKSLNLFPFSYEGPGSYFLPAVFVNLQRRTEERSCRYGGRLCSISDCFALETIGLFFKCHTSNKTW